MIKSAGTIVMLLFLFACTSRNVPDVSGIMIDLPVLRFEKDFFAIDTNHVDRSLEELNRKYPGFVQDFVFNILALPAGPDSAAAVENGVRSFLNSYGSLKKDADKVFSSFDPLHKEIVTGLQFVKHYFPGYRIPSRLITFIGPVNSFGNIITPDALGVGLQLYLGKDYPLYLSEAGQSLYPAYVSRRFEPQYIPVNTMKTVIDDMYPNNSIGRPLVEQMVEAGKRLYLLDLLLPDTPDTLKTGYTANQLRGAYDHEEDIWSLFLNNDLLYATEPGITKDYMNDAPNTPALGEGSPGFIGQFVGWQIVKKWMGKNSQVHPGVLMKKDPRQLFIESKYKPR